MIFMKKIGYLTRGFMGLEQMEQHLAVRDWRAFQVKGRLVVFAQGRQGLCTAE